MKIGGPFLACLVIAGIFSTAHGAAQDHAAVREQAARLFKDGNYAEALGRYRQLSLEAENDPKLIGEDLVQALLCLQNLNRLHEVDALREKAIAVHGANWRLLQAAARTYFDFNHWGYLVAGEFHRGSHRGGGEYVSALQRDRVRTLQLMRQAASLAEKDPAKREIGRFYIEFARLLGPSSGIHEAWHLNGLTDLDSLPDYEPGYSYRYAGIPGQPGAAVDADGRPRLHSLPKGFEAARSDGERWRWLLRRAVEFDPALEAGALLTYASFLNEQFGVQTLQEYGTLFSGGRQRAESEQAETGPYAVHTLADSETIAKLAIGVRRFSLPDEHNPIRIFKEILRGQKDSATGREAGRALARIYENRRQFGRALEYWETLRRHDPEAQKQIDQIKKNWGMFESTVTQPALGRPSVEFRYRNGARVDLEAFPIRIGRLLEDIKAYLRSGPERLDWNRLNPNDIGRRLVQDNQTQYLGEKAAAWSLELKPDPRHWDRRTTIELPESLKAAGAYLLQARMPEGNLSRIVIFVADTAIVEKPIDGKFLYYVADAVSGLPLAEVPVEFFGYRTRPVKDTRSFKVEHTAFSRRSNADGLVALGPEEASREMNWLVTAATAEGRLAFLGFSNIWHLNYADPDYYEAKTFVMTDRPVYRPKDSVRFKLWLGQTHYGQYEPSRFGGQRFTVRIHNPKNEEVYSQTLTADEHGGMESELKLPADAALGVYRISHDRSGRIGGQTFRVEEYKKPEFEVTIAAPKEPVMLGETVNAAITARYYFGAPVAEAAVRYKVLRSEHDSRWYPAFDWDWLYGPGYWWFGYDYEWLPGWERWGCRRPAWSWWPSGPRIPPEVVAEVETAIGPDGTLAIPIDTGLAKWLYGDRDHRYTVQVEVRDASRRTITAQGEVLVARQPFKVYAWADRGHFRAGDTVQASFKAQSLDRKPVAGSGRLRLLRIDYRDAKPVETEVERWELPTGADGSARHKIQAAAAGQYRLSYNLTDAKGRSIEGGYVFTVAGTATSGEGFRFAKLELLADKAEYRPGETVRLMVNTDRPGAAVLLFVRPVGGVGLAPRVLRPEGRSAFEEIAVTAQDMPNFFVEALTVYDGKLYSETREIAVPPEKRLINAEVVASQPAFRPGEKAQLKLKLTDPGGAPFQGEAVLTVYDRALEYIAGGSNAPEIRSFFWKWRRSHYPRSQSSLSRWSYNLVKSNEVPMRGIGVFGDLLAAEEDTYRERRSGETQDLRMAPKRAEAADSAGAAKTRVSAAAGPAAPAPGLDEEPASGEGFQAPVVRTQFADTAYWAGRVRTDEKGLATVEFNLPENLTAWKVKLWAMGPGTRVGEAAAEIVTRKDLVLRLQAPRFFVETDEVVLSANVHNYLGREKKVRARLEIEGGCLALSAGEAAERPVTIGAGGEKRIDWRVKVVKEGEAVVRMLALTDAESDAMQMRFPVIVHGLAKQVPKTGVIRPEQAEASMVFTVPAERRVDLSRLELRYSPTLAGAMVDALPYLASYPYGCTEQTLNRFVPAVITQRVLKNLGLNLAAIKAKRTNLNAQEIGKADPGGRGWQRLNANPVFDEGEVADMVTAGVKRLAAMQLSDGGWGWFSGYGEKSYAHTTALVVHGLQIAAANEVPVPADMLGRGVRWLTAYQEAEMARLKEWEQTRKTGKSQADNLDAFVYMVLVDQKTDRPQMREYLYRDRTALAVYGKAMFGLALHKLGDGEKLAMIVRNIEQYLVEDPENETAYLNLPASGYWWYWYGSEYETQAYYLKLLSKTAGGGQKAARLVKYLLNNRRHATYWNSTRDTAVVIEAFADYLAASREDDPNLTIDILYDGRPVKRVTIDRENLFSFDNAFTLAGAEVATGSHTLTIKKSGRGAVYFNAYLDYFSLEDFIQGSGLEIKVERRVFKLKETGKTVTDVDSRGMPVDRRAQKYERVPLDNLATLRSGERVEVELVIESKNDYEYLVFEDQKAAGFEPVEVRSGYTGNALGAYVEFRDQKVCFFARHLARGRHSVSYQLRAEIPGKFSALPTIAYAMYAPELKANSDEIKLKIVD